MGLAHLPGRLGVSHISHRYEKNGRGWALLWHSENQLNGVTEHLMGPGSLPVVGPGPMLFSTYKQARQYLRDNYTYLKTREDLRREPHGWRMPRIVRVSVSVRVEKIEKIDTPDVSSEEVGQ